MGPIGESGFRVGVDGCKNGWFFFQFGDQVLTFGVIPRLSVLLDSLPDASVVLIDIPIGLREADHGERLCDVAARNVLKPTRSSSVFPAPARQAIHASSYEEASALNKSVLGKKLSKQSWAITPKIREVDELLLGSPRARSMVREAHPEVCFWGMNGAPMLFSKKTREGFKERLEVLAARYPPAADVVSKAFLEHGGFEAARDDILDALVAALCAERIDDCLTLPDTPEGDPKELPMEMVYLPLQSL